jgi:ABC-type Fe3+/spermidine/putrescine transport system ATPase subunit
MSDRVAVMSGGRIEQLDEPRVIYDRPRTAFVAEFIGEMNLLDGEVTASENGSFTVDAGSGVVVHGRGDADKGARISVGIRSERMVAAPGVADPAANSAPAEVIYKVYLGDQIQIVARLANGSDVVVREQRTDPALDTIHPGDRVTVSWDESCALIFGAADSAIESSKEEA